MVVLFAVFYWDIKGIFEYFFGYRSYICQDLEVYTEDTYLDFDQGEKFKEYLKEAMCDKGTATLFHYQDNYGADSKKYGKKGDIYILEIKLEEAEYLNYKEEIVRERTIYGEGVYKVCYYNEKKSLQDGLLYLIFFNDEECTVRYLMQTEYTIELPYIYTIREVKKLSFY